MAAKGQASEVMRVEDCRSSGACWGCNEEKSSRWFEHACYRDVMWMRRVAYEYRYCMFKYAKWYAPRQVSSRISYAIWYKRGGQLQRMDSMNNLKYRMQVS